MSQQKYASMSPKDMTEGSGLFDDVDATITDVKFTKEAPDNYSAEGNPIFSKVSFLLKGDGPVEERSTSQTYSLGATAGDHFTVSQDGYGLIPTGDTLSTRKDSKWGTFLATLLNEGLPENILAAGNMSALIGIDGHFKRIADKQRNFVNDQKAKSKYPPSTLLCTKIHKLPGEATASLPTSAGTTVTAGSAPTTTEAGDLDVDTWGYLETALKAAKGNTEQRGRLTLLVSRAATKDPNRQAIARRAGEESFINEMVTMGMITYAADQKGQPVSLAG